MKCSDIPDDLFLEVVRYTLPRHELPADWEPGKPLPDGREPWRMRWDVKANLEFVLGHPVPENLFLAKARKLGQKGKLFGCTDCSCRGDYHLPSEHVPLGC